MTSKDSNQPVHPPSIARVLVYSSWDSLKIVQGTHKQHRLWSDCTDVQAYLSLYWLHKSCRRFRHALAHFSKETCYNSHWANSKECTQNKFLWEIRNKYLSGNFPNPQLSYLAPFQLTIKSYLLKMHGYIFKGDNSVKMDCPLLKRGPL